MFGALALATVLAVSGGWIHAKAAMAQVLLQRAWTQSEHGRQTRPPWPWADIAPLAELSVPRLKEHMIVLDGDSGQALAFGPGWRRSSAVPGSHGLTVISAHRDTQFRFLKALRAGDRIHLDGPHGSADYRVESGAVMDSRSARVPGASRMDGLWLVTCYPFDAIVPGGPLRYVVQARRATAAEKNSRLAGTNPKEAGHML